MSNVNVSLRPFNLKLKYPFGISRGSITSAKNILVTLSFDDFVAYGESAPSVYYGEDQKSVMDFIQAFTKRRKLEDYITNIHMLKQELSDFSNILTTTNSSSSARAALEMAFWDLIGKINNKPVYDFIFQDDPFMQNGKNNSLPETSYTIGADTLLVMKEKTLNALKLGFKILKIKLGLGLENDLNVLKMLKEISKENSTSCTLRVDANGGWDFETTKKMIDILPDYNVQILEQPLPRGQVHMLSSITSASSIPIFVDEDCLSLHDVEKVAGKVSGINIKLMKCGSIIDAVSMINLAKSYNLKVMLGCMIESSCAISAAAHLSPLADYIDLDGHLLLEHDPFCGLILEDNEIIPSFSSGLGVELSCA